MKLNYPAVLTALRTAGALMLGNVFVSIFLFDNENWKALAWLCGLALAAIITTSIESRSTT